MSPTQKARVPLIPGLSRKQIADKLGVSWRTVEGWEQGRRPVPRWIMIQVNRLIKPNRRAKK